MVQYFTSKNSAKIQKEIHSATTEHTAPKNFAKNKAKFLGAICTFMRKSDSNLEYKT